jgi:microcystin-dependent protein
MARNYSSVVEPKTLTGTVSSAATQITLNNVTGLPSPPYILVINPDTAKEEAVLVTVDQTGVTSPTLKVTRAVEASGGAGTAQDHTIGDTVKHMIVGSDLQIVHDHFSDNSLTTGTAHGVSGGVVGRTSSQTLTNKAISLGDNTVTGTTAQFNNALSDADFATTALLEARVPVGAVNMWVTGTAPSGWLLCQGQEVAVATYSALSSVLGTTYGSLTNGSGGAGTTHFRLPDLRGRIPMGAGTGRNVADSADLTARTLGAKVSDAETHTLTTAEIPGHTHPNALTGTTTFAAATHYHGVNSNFTASYFLGNGFYYTEGGTIVGNGTAVTGANDNTASVGLSNGTNTGGGGAHNNVQPSTVINFIIKH